MITIPGPIPIRIYPYFWAIAALLGWMASHSIPDTCIWMIVICFSVIAHELGHALTAMLFGQSAEIELVALGGVTIRHGEKIKPWQEFLIILNGPLAGLLVWIFLVGFSSTLSDVPRTVGYALFAALYVNWYWSLFNLLPVVPMDGGRLLTILLERCFGQKGLRAAFGISMVVAGSASAYFFVQAMYYAGGLLFLFMYESYCKWQASFTLSEYDHDEWLQRLMLEAEQDLNKGQVENAKYKFMNIRETAGKGVLYLKASEYIAQILALQGKHQEAIEVLNPVQRNLSPQCIWLLQHLYYRMGDFSKAIKVGLRAYQEEPRWEAALINAMSYAQVGEVKAAVGWLQCAVREGMTNLSEVVNKQDFDRIRNEEMFQKTFRN